MSMWPRTCRQRRSETSAPVCNTGAAGTIGDANICVYGAGSLHYVNRFGDFHQTSILMKCIVFI